MTTPAGASQRSKMLCAYCGRDKGWPEAFPSSVMAECWECVWVRHQATFHPAKRRWHLRWPIFRDPTPNAPSEPPS